MKFSCLDNSPTDSPSIKVNSGPLLPSPTPTTTECTVLVETKQSMYLCHPPTHLYEVYTSRLESHQCKQGNIAINLIGSTLYIVITAFLPHTCSLVYADSLAASSQPVIVAVGVALGLMICGSCVLAGFWLKRRYCTCTNV